METVMHFQNELLLLKADVSKLLSLVLESFEMAVKSLESGDIKLAERVIALDDPIDDLTRKIEDSCYQIIARYNPLAKELRYEMTMVKFANNLERIADLGCNVAEYTKKIHDQNIKMELIPEIREMMGKALDTLKDAFKAFGERNIELAIATWKKDDDIDELEDRVNEYVIKNLGTSLEDKVLAVAYVLLARDLERAGDHANNLCEETVYIETGKSIKEFVGAKEAQHKD